MTRLLGQRLVAWLDPVRLPVVAKSPIDEELIRRQCMARETLKAQRREIDRKDRVRELAMVIRS